MRKRDKAIIDNLNRFRVMSRDDICDIHFSNVKNSVNSANTVLKRLHRDGHVKRSETFQPFVYFPGDSTMKKDSQKIPHFLALVDVYKQLRKYKEPKQFVIEPKYGKQYMEPDIFTIWKGLPMFIEVQRNVYSDKVMSDKIKRYESYFYSDEWQKEPWQPRDKKVFPSILMLTDTRYAIASDCLRVNQCRTVDEFVESVGGKREEPKSRNDIKVNGTTKIKLK